MPNPAGPSLAFEMPHIRFDTQNDSTVHMQSMILAAKIPWAAGEECAGETWVSHYGKNLVESIAVTSSTLQAVIDLSRRVHRSFLDSGRRLWNQ